MITTSPVQKQMRSSIALKTLSVFLILLIVGSASLLSVALAQPQTDGWVQLANLQVPGGDVAALALAPSDVNFMYTLVNVELGGMRLFGSQDGGASWQELYLFPTSPENNFNSLTVDPADPLTVYASGGTSLKRSQDGGATWETLSSPGDVFTAVSSELLYAGGGAESCGYGKVSNLVRSEDGGQTWKTFPLGCLGNVEQIAVLPSQPDVIYLSVMLYAAPSSTLLKSTDGGQTWTDFSLPDQGAVFQLLIDPENPQRLFASVLYSEIVASVNGGQTWQVISNKSMAGGFRLAISGGSLYAASEIESKSSLYRTDDGGVTWWESLTLLPEGARALQADPVQANRLWVGLLGYGIYLTDDGGDTWTEQNSGINSRAMIKTLAAATSDPNVIYATVDDPYARGISIS